MAKKSKSKKLIPTSKKPKSSLKDAEDKLEKKLKEVSADKIDQVINEIANYDKTISELKGKIEKQDEEIAKLQLNKSKVKSKTSKPSVNFWLFCWVFISSVLPILLGYFFLDDVIEKLKCLEELAVFGISLVYYLLLGLNFVGVVYATNKIPLDGENESKTSKDKEQVQSMIPVLQIVFIVLLILFFISVIVASFYPFYVYNEIYKSSKEGETCIQSCDQSCETDCIKICEPKPCPDQNTQPPKPENPINIHIENNSEANSGKKKN